MGVFDGFSCGHSNPLRHDHIIVIKWYIIGNLTPLKDKSFKLLSWKGWQGRDHSPPTNVGGEIWCRTIKSRFYGMLLLHLVLVTAPRVFFPGSPVFLPSQKPTLLHSTSIWKQWMMSYSVDMPMQILIYSNYFFYLFIYSFIHLFIYLFKLLWATLSKKN